MASETEQAMQHRDRHRLQPQATLKVRHPYPNRHDRRAIAVQARIDAREKARKEEA